jgi:hypothetical protein
MIIGEEVYTLVRANCIPIYETHGVSSLVIHKGEVCLRNNVDIAHSDR